ncbi:MAG: DedA family protein, partial [Acidimicrobiales bacterium]
MTVGKFIAYTVVGSAAYDALLAGIGYSLGASWHHVIKDFSDAGYVLAALLVATVIGILMHRLSVVRAERAGRAPQGLQARLREIAQHLPQWTQRALAALHIDWDPPRRRPKAVAVVVATVISIVGSLAADAILVKIAETVFPSTNGYAHFQFSDYSKLTVIGVVIACVAWPITTRISSTPRWVFFRMAIAVTIVLWSPDLWILVHDGQPIKAVAFLMLMHLAIALVTYNALVHLAPAGRRRRRAVRTESIEEIAGPRIYVGGTSPRREPSEPR